MLGWDISFLAMARYEWVRDHGSGSYARELDCRCMERPGARWIRNIIGSAWRRVFYSILLLPKRQASRSMRSNLFDEESGCLGLLTKLPCRSANKWVEPFVLALYTVPRCLLNLSSFSFFRLLIVVPLLQLPNLIVKNHALIINRIMVPAWVWFGTGSLLWVLPSLPRGWIAACIYQQ